MPDPLVTSVTLEEASECPRVIHVDRTKLLERASLTQRQRRREESEERRLGNRQSSWLFNGTKRSREETLEPPSPFINNVVVSAKYGVWNFLPRVLLAQVKRPSNMYFLFIALLQTIKEISNTSGIPTILLPLAVVLVCSAIKEALEDRERHRADHVANNRPVMMLTPLNTWEERPWGDLRVGDIVKVMKDQTIPADLLLLSVSGAGHDDDGESQQQLQAATSDTFLGLNDKAQANKNSTESSMYVLGLHNVSQFSGKHQVESDVAYIETKSLDGETNLKIRTVVPLVADICGGANRQSHTFDGGNLNALRGTMVCEQPNNRLTSFEGTFSVILNPTQAQTLKEKSPLSTSAPSPAKYLQIEATDNGFACVHVPVTAKQMLLRSCVLRNTRSVIGMVVFTGHETKVFCSNTEPVVKTSSVERRLNKLIINIVFLQQLVCFLGALFGAYWMYSGGASLWYLVDASERRHHNSASVSATHPLAELVKLHLRYFIIMQNFVPISLNVSLEFVKYWQAYFIEQDLEMYDKQLDAPAIVRSSALNEDLGRVHHIFTDKTGTLTMNLMLFRYLMVGRKHYGGPIQETELKPKLSKEIEQAGLAKGPRFVDFDPTELFADILAGGEQAKMLRHFLRHLALCHTLIPAKSLAEMCSTSFPEYSASSPDEQALVSAAAFCNVRFVHRTSTAMMLMEPGWITPCTYKLLNVIEFESDRKRMSVIVETPDGKIELLCKGADDVIFERLAMDQATKFGGMSCEQASNQLSLYAKAGMRTLCLAYKSIARHEYEKWNARFMEAHASMEDVDKRRHGLRYCLMIWMYDKLEARITLPLRQLYENYPSPMIIKFLFLISHKF
ncbi:putative P-type ATPase, subfamily IV, P-type ATPase, A domain superfamily [Plasmopara halstedii]